MKVNIKDILKKNYIYIIMILAIIAGAIVIGLKGFEFSIENKDHQRLEVILDAPYNDKDMDEIIKSTIKDSYILRTSSLFGTTVAIDSVDFTDEEITAILNKINEKYGTQYSLKNLKLADIIEQYELSDIEGKEDTEINEIIEKIKTEHNLEYTKDELADTESIKVDLTDIKAINILDTVKKFVIPVVISIIAIILYMGIRAMKYDKLVMLRVFVKLLITELFLVAVIAIIRLPLSNLVITGLTVIGIAELVVFNIQNEKVISEKKEEKAKKKK